MFRGSYNLGSTNGAGSSSRIYNYCRKTTSDPSLCINQFITITNSSTNVPLPTGFVYSFTYTGDLSLDSILEYYIPIDSSDNILQYTYSYTTSNNVTTVAVSFTFIDNGTTNDGLIFSPNVLSFYNMNTTNLKILQFYNIPLSRRGSQFQGINNLIVDVNDKPGKRGYNIMVSL